MSSSYSAKRLPEPGSPFPCGQRPYIEKEKNPILSKKGCARMIAVQDAKLRGIPSLIIADEEKKSLPLPTVIFWHGFTSAKEHNLHYAFLLAKEGLRVILPDALYHGDRGEGVSQKKLSLSFWAIVLQGIRDSSAVRDALEERKLIADGRLFMAGTSMGGILTSGALAAFNWVRGGAVLMGNPSWETFARQQISRLTQEGVLNLSVEETEKQVAALRPYDISTQVEKFKDRPLFFWHGKLDDVVPYHSAYTFYQALHEAVDVQEDNAVFHLEPASGHKVTREGMLAMVKWVAGKI